MSKFRPLCLEGANWNEKPIFLPLFRCRFIVNLPSSNICAVFFHRTAQEATYCPGKELPLYPTFLRKTRDLPRQAWNPVMKTAMFSPPLNFPHIFAICPNWLTKLSGSIFTSKWHGTQLSTQWEMTWWLSEHQYITITAKACWVLSNIDIIDLFHLDL